MQVGYVNEDRSHAFVLVSFELSMSSKECSALSLKKGAFEPFLVADTETNTPMNKRAQSVLTNPPILSHPRARSII